MLNASLHLFQVMSENISAAIAVNGEIVMKQPLIKSMRVVKKETLKLISDWVSRTNDHQMVSFSAHKLLFVFPETSLNLYPFILFVQSILTEITLTGIGKLYTAIIGCCFTGLSKDECSLC